jgi:undecaprenyl-diphosphatase
VSYLEAIVFGIVQGLTEFLPISSSGHLRIVPAFLGWEDPGAAFSAIIQLGTSLAVVIYFAKDLWRIASTWFRSLYTPELRSTLDARMGWFIGLGTIPICVFGLAFSDQIETGARNLWLIATTLIVLGVVLQVADMQANRAERRDLTQLRLRDGIAVGFAQALALIPGVSRSGSTITMGLFLGLTRETAARFSFLLSTPAVVLSAAFEMRKIGEGGGAGLGPTLVATIASFIVGYAAIAWLLKYVSNHSFLPFVIYRIGLGVVLLVLLATGAVSAT